VNASGKQNLDPLLPTQDCLGGEVESTDAREGFIIEFDSDRMGFAVGKDIYDRTSPGDLARVFDSRDGFECVFDAPLDKFFRVEWGLGLELNRTKLPVVGSNVTRFKRGKGCEVYIRSFRLEGSERSKARAARVGVVLFDSR
jgi:hypothetical protein